MSNCEICGRAFTSKGNLNQHVKQVHNKERNYRCEDCRRTFTRSHDMRKHRERVHGVSTGPVVTYTRTVTRVETVTRSETKFETRPPKPSARPKSRWGEGALPPPRGSRGERDVESALRINEVGYIREKTFDGLVGLGGGSLRYDFAVPVLGGAHLGPSPVLGGAHLGPSPVLGGAHLGPSPVLGGFLLIEYDGRQHFVPTRWGKSMTQSEAEKCFEKLQKHDETKNKYARSRGYPLLRIPFYKSRKIYPIVEEFLRQHGLVH